MFQNFIQKNQKFHEKIQKNGKKIVSSSLVLHHLKKIDDETPTRFGFTASKKVGGAVLRNKAKRRMRSLVNELKNDFKPNGQDYVLIARKQVVNHDYNKIKDELINSIRTLSN